MNWEAAIGIAEIVGALAVVISVVYLAMQVRKQTEETRLAATRELAAQFQDILEPFVLDEKLIAVFRKAIRNYEGLPDDDRLRMSYLFSRMFRFFEQQYLHTSLGNVETSYFESINLAHMELLTFPGVQQWWQLCVEFGPAFHDHVEEMLVEAKSRGYHSSFAHNDENAG